VSSNASFSPSAAGFAPVVLAFLAACVPTGNAPPYDAGPAPASSPTFRASVGIMTAPFEDEFDRPDGGEIAAQPVDAGPFVPSLESRVTTTAQDGGRDAGEDASVLAANDAGADGGEARKNASNLGPDWTAARTSAWRVENGRLCGENAKNHCVWLNRVLPVNARIEFDAISYSENGDLKVEVWGDGHSFATGTSYTNATSYLAILGGWDNTLHVLARLNEHGKDRKELKIDPNSDDPRDRPVVRGQTYQFKIERTDGKTIRWSVNGVDYISWNDPSPLAGQGHDHIGFNDWMAKVCFDNVKITPL
jgi:hypothetical protein